MNLALIPLLLVALMLATTDQDVQTVEFVLEGQHDVTDHDGGLIVGDARVTIPAGAEVPGPIYVIGGQLVVAGAVATDVIQLAGTVTVQSGGEVADELRLIGGTQSVATGAEIGRRTTLEVTPGGGRRGGGLAVTVLATLLLGWVGARMTRTRREVLDNVTAAVLEHPVVSTTVGLLLVLTASALLVFMAFTLVLIPVALVGVLVGLATSAYGVVVWGHLIGVRLPVQSPPLATGLGVAITMAALQLAPQIPVIGGLFAALIVLAAIGAIAITYYGLMAFRPAALPD